MLEAMTKLIQEQDLIPPGSRIVCAVSGGADSLCLLHALYHLQEKLDFTLAAAHYNHQLRGEESDRDAEFVDQFVHLCCCQWYGTGHQKGVPLYLFSGDVAREAALRGTGLEETARAMRYAFLRQVAEWFRADAIATAHNAGDNGETILLHLARGSGLRGLTGIQPKGNGLIRPLLTTTRKEIEDYLFYYGLPHREDASNADDAYARNRIRHQVMPVLEELYPGLAQRMMDTAARLRADEDYLNAQAEQLSAQAQRRGDGLVIPAAVIGAAPDPLAFRAVRQLLAAVNDGDANCTAVHLESVVQLCRKHEPSAQVSLPHGLVARREYGSLVLERPLPVCLPAEVSLSLPGCTDWGNWRIACTRERWNEQGQSPYDFCLRTQDVSELTVRARRTGDFLAPPGRPRKTLKKWMIEAHLPRHIRDTLPVFAQDGRTVAAAGLGPDRDFVPGPQKDQDVWHVVAVPLPDSRPLEQDLF